MFTCNSYLNDVITFVGNAMDKNYDVITFSIKYHCFKKPGVAIFAGIIKIITMFTKPIFKDS